MIDIDNSRSLNWIQIFIGTIFYDNFMLISDAKARRCGYKKTQTLYSIIALEKILLHIYHDFLQFFFFL